MSGSSDTLELLGVERAWQRTRGHPAVLVGIVDSGVQIDHPLLRDNLRITHLELFGAPAVRDAHGTHSAGVVVGVAPDARLLPASFNATPATSDEELALAIEQAVDEGACIVNISVATARPLPRVKRAIRHAATRNVLVVAAAGNEMCDLALARVFPAAFALEDAASVPNLVVVMAVTAKLTPASNYSAMGVHLAAPNHARVPELRRAGQTAAFGSSVSAPYVAGCAALLKAMHPHWGYIELKEHLLASGTFHPELQWKCASGRALNVHDAVCGPLDWPREHIHWQCSAQTGGELSWQLKYRSRFCVKATAEYRPEGARDWRQIGAGDVVEQRLTLKPGLPAGRGRVRLTVAGTQFRTDEGDLEIT